MRRARVLVAVALALGASVGAATPQPPRPGTGLIPTVHELLRGVYAPNRPGAVALVARDGRPFFRRAYGLADAEFGIMLEPDMMFRIGSVTKQFTAGVALRLAEQGKLSLAAPLGTYMTELPEAWAGITLEHLLSHTSGLPNYTALPGYGPNMSEDVTVEALIGRFRDLPLEFAPGTQWKYSNSGYALAGAVIERVTGRTFQDVLHDELLTRLGLHRTVYDSPATVIPRRARGYQQRGKEIFNAPYLSMTQPFAAGALASTLDDLLTWDTALTEGKVLQPESLARMFTPARLSDGSPTEYGLGWVLSSYDDHAVAEHSGGISGFSCHVIRVPDARVYVAVLSNVQRQDASPRGLARRIAALTLGAPTEPPAAVPLPDSVLDSYRGQYALPNENVVSISPTDRSLAARMPGGQTTFDPIGNDEFIERDGVLRLSFQRDGDGHVHGFVRSGWGAPVEARRQR